MKIKIMLAVTVSLISLLSAGGIVGGASNSLQAFDDQQEAARDAMSRRSHNGVYRNNGSGITVLSTIPVSDLGGGAAITPPPTSQKKLMFYGAYSTTKYSVELNEVRFENAVDSSFSVFILQKDRLYFKPIGKRYTWSNNKEEFLETKSKDLNLKAMYAPAGNLKNGVYSFYFKISVNPKTRKVIISGKAGGTGNSYYSSFESINKKNEICVKKHTVDRFRRWVDVYSCIKYRWE